jgi:hypothetical protein
MTSNGPSAARPLGAVGLAHFGVADAGLLQVLARQARQLGLDLQRDHALGAAGQQGGHVAGAGADFQHLLVRARVHFLQQAGLDLGLQHAPGPGGRPRRGWPRSGISMSTKASALCAAARSPRGGWCPAGSTSRSSTSQGRICCSIMLKRSWSMEGVVMVGGRGYGCDKPSILEAGTGRAPPPPVARACGAAGRAAACPRPGPGRPGSNRPPAPPPASAARR